MMMKRFGWLVAAAIVLAGCSGGGNKVTQNEHAPSHQDLTPQATTGGGNPADPNNPPVPDQTKETHNDPAKPGEINANAGSADLGPTKVDQPPVEIDPNDSKWQKPTRTKTPGELAKKMDDALLNLKNAKIQSIITYSVPSVGKLNGQSLGKIEDKDTFLLEYYMPQTEGNKNRMVSADGESAYMRNGKWVGKKPSLNTKRLTSDAGVIEWEETFAEDMYARYLASQDGWAPIIKAWGEGRGGYKLKMEEQVAQGKPFYRLLATREGSSKAMVEVRVDGTRYLPLAIRVIRTNKDGSEEKLFWNGAWSFGGTFEKSEFPVPAVKS